MVSGVRQVRRRVVGAGGGAFVVQDGDFTKYNSLQVDLRRRLADQLEALEALKEARQPQGGGSRGEAGDTLAG